MTEIIDLSQEIYGGMPVYRGLPEVAISIHASHEEWDGLDAAVGRTPAALQLTLSEHTGTHVDAISHMVREYADMSIDRMPLEMFYTRGICIDLSAKRTRELIEPDDLESALRAADAIVRPGDTILLHTDHYRRAFGTPDWPNGPGVSVAATEWLAARGVAAFGVETMSPGVVDVSNAAVHRVCGARGITHYENLMNLHLLLGRGAFRFIGLPLRIRGGTGSPVRAVAVFENHADNLAPPSAATTLARRGRSD